MSATHPRSPPTVSDAEAMPGVGCACCMQFWQNYVPGLCDDAPQSREQKAGSGQRQEGRMGRQRV